MLKSGFFGKVSLPGDAVTSTWAVVHVKEVPSSPFLVPVLLKNRLFAALVSFLVEMVKKWVTFSGLFLGWVASALELSGLRGSFYYPALRFRSHACLSLLYDLE